MESFKVIPAIDIMDGKCVRLIRGNYDLQTIYDKKPVEVAKTFLDAGFDLLHIVDLDGARAGKPVNLNAVESIAKIGVRIELGGGLRTQLHFQQAINSGATEIILGSLLIRSDELPLRDWSQSFAGKLVAGIDARSGMVAVHGWETTTRITATELVKKVETLGVNRVIYTDIARDGMLAGPNLEQLKNIARSTSLPIVASGGISSTEDILAIKRFESVGVKGAIVGKAYYEGKITLEEMYQC